MPGEDPLFVGVNSKKKRRCWTCCTCALLITTLLTAALAIGLGVSYGTGAIGNDVQLFIDQTVALVNGSQGTQEWASPPPVIFASYYLFNITNSEAVSNGAKPNLKLIGPFVYSENKTKINLRWNEAETIIGYDKLTYYNFLSNGSFGDPHTTMVTTVNLPLIGLLINLEKLESSLNTSTLTGKFLATLVSTLADTLETAFNEHLFITKSVNDLLWGYEDPILHFVLDAVEELGLPDSIVQPIVEGLNGGKFGLQTNNTIDGPNMVFTGKSGTTFAARYIMWNKQTSMTKWGTPYAGMINGTDGTLFHPGVTKNDTLYVFVDQLFRSGYFKYGSDVTNNGIKLYRFVLPAEELRNDTQDPGFYPHGLSGVLNLTAVFPLNVPVFVSKPLFLDADPYYRSLVTGLDPVDRNKWDSYLDVEPLTGGVLNAAKRLQINLEMRRYPNFTALAKLQEYTLLPVFIAVEAGGLNSTLADEFRSKVYTPVQGISYGAIGVTGLAGLIAIVCLLFLFIILVYRCEVAVKKRREEGMPLLANTNTN